MRRLEKVSDVGYCVLDQWIGYGGLGTLFYYSVSDFDEEIFVLLGTGSFNSLLTKENSQFYCSS